MSSAEQRKHGMRHPKEKVRSGVILLRKRTVQRRSADCVHFSARAAHLCACLQEQLCLACRALLGDMVAAVLAAAHQPSADTQQLPQQAVGWTE